MMERKKYISPQSTIVFCEKRLLYTPSQFTEWTDEAYGKRTDYEESNWGSDDDGGLWNPNFSSTKPNPDKLPRGFFDDDWTHDFTPKR